MTRLRHAVTADGGIMLTITEPGRAPRPVPVSASEARRLAWALLADIDPAEAQMAADEELRGLPLSWDYSGRPRLRTVRPVQGKLAGTVSHRILQTLKTGPATSKALSAVVDREISAVSALCCGLMKAGAVSRDLANRGGVATWSLTPLGEQRAAA